MHAMDSGESWTGITVMCGSLRLNYVEMADCDSVCIYTNDAQSVKISHCVLHGNKMVQDAPVLRLWDSYDKGILVDNTVVTDVPVGVGFYPRNSYLKFLNVTFEDCDVVNSYIKSVTGNFTNCVFRGRASKYGVMFNITGNTPNFQCCTFENVSPLSGSYANMIYAFSGTAPSFGYTGSAEGVSNTFTDSSDYMMRMFGSGVKPVIASEGDGVGGYNDWTQNKTSGKYICWNSPYPNPVKPYYAKGQYWNKQPVSESYFYPSNSSYWSLSGSSARPWGLCGGEAYVVHDRGAPGQTGLDDYVSVYDSLFAIAMGHEINEEFGFSQPLFRTIASEADDYELVWISMTHAALNQGFLQDSLDGSWIIPMIDSLENASPDSMVYDAYLSGERLKGSYHLSLRVFNSAVDVLADLLESGLTESDSLLVSVELLNVYVASGIMEDDGSLDGTLVARVPSQLRARSDAEAWSLEQEILARFGKILDNQSPTSREPLPLEYRLYQCYPNPFNPTTQIEFDLPQGAPVTLKVFNTLGQEVTTLLDATRPAGHHVVMWNGKNTMGEDVATGLYVYQIQAGSFTDAKKMILLR